MKFIIATCLLVSSVASQAASERRIYDLMYLPKAGTTFGISDVYVNYGETELKNSQKSKDTGYMVIQSIGYSFSDNFSLQADINYTKSETKNENSSFSNGSTTRKGLSDPTLYGRYRALDNEFRFDLIAGLDLSIGNAEIESNGDSNNRNGGHTFIFGFDFGQVLQDFQWSTRFRANLHQDSDIELNGKEFERDGFEHYELSFLALVKLTNDLNLAPIATAIVVDGGSRAYGMGGDLQFVISPDFMLKTGLAISTVDHDTVDSDYSLSARFGAIYQF